MAHFISVLILVVMATNMFLFSGQFFRTFVAGVLLWWTDVAGSLYEVECYTQAVCFILIT